MSHLSRFPNIIGQRKVVNMCVPGQKTTQLLDVLRSVNSPYSPKRIPFDHPYHHKNVRRIVIHIGTNDLNLPDLTAEDITDNIVDIITLVQNHILKSSPDGSKAVCFLGLLPRNHKKDPPHYKETIKDINRRLKLMYQGQGIYISPPKCLTNDKGCIQEEYYHTDKLHLSEEGLVQLFDCVARFVDRPLHHHVVMVYMTSEKFEEFRMRRLCRIRLDLPLLKWRDNRRWSDWVF